MGGFLFVNCLHYCGAYDILIKNMKMQGGNRNECP